MTRHPLTAGAARLRRQDGYVMIIALGVMLVVSLLITAVFVAVRSDYSGTQVDTNGKGAYAAAQAGLQAYLYNLNDNSANSQWWQTCSNDAGSGTVGSTGETYTYAPVIACTTGNAIGTVVDSSTGQLRMEFTGKQGTATRTIVAAFQTTSPLSFLWYTVHETLDPATVGDSTCSNFYSGSTQPDQGCILQWITGDKVQGPMYTQDEFYVPSGNAPQFGGSSTDKIETTSPSLCVPLQGTANPNPCPTGVVVGTPETNAPLIKLPADNSNLLQDAGQTGNTVLPAGVTTLTLNGGTSAVAATCTTSSASSCSQTTVNLNSSIIYAPNGSSCSPSYNPQSVSYTNTISATGTYHGDYYGSCGDIYVQGTYAYPLTLAAADNIIATGSLLNSTDSTGGTMPTGTATLGLVANEYVRVADPISSGGPASSSPCYAAANNITLDAAILTLQHSFFVDNYQCGASSASGLGTLTVHGAIAQYYRGAVGGTTCYNQSCSSEIYGGYLKNYQYDKRLQLLLPPYLFDLQDASWQVVRETMCSPTLPASNASSCADQS
jgi:Tfp pilus assembly protein PilX